MGEGIDLLTLLGAHELSGAENGYLSDDRALLYFILDGVTYAAIEGDNDGYRSYLEGIYRSDVAVSNTFAPVAVMVVHRTEGKYGEDDVLELRDAANGALVLEVGTSNIDDYYPSYVGYFYPEAMAVNQEVSE